MSPLLRLNVGGKFFTTLRSTLERSPVLLDQLAHLPRDPSNPSVPFLDMDPAVFRYVLHYLRTGDRAALRPRTPLLASGIYHTLAAWEILPKCMKTSHEKTSEQQPPNRLVVHLCDQFQQDVGVKRHGISICYGSPGFAVSALTRRIRKELRSQLASTYWQIHKTHERAAFFQCTKIPTGTADLLLTTVTQQVIEHTESQGYSLDNSYVTMTPDPGHLQIRLILHCLLFKRDRPLVLGGGREEMEDMKASSLLETTSAQEEGVGGEANPIEGWKLDDNKGTEENNKEYRAGSSEAATGNGALHSDSENIYDENGNVIHPGSLPLPSGAPQSPKWATLESKDETKDVVKKEGSGITGIAPTLTDVGHQIGPIPPKIMSDRLEGIWPE